MHIFVISLSSFSPIISLSLSRQQPLKSIMISYRDPGNKPRVSFFRTHFRLTTFAMDQACDLFPSLDGYRMKADAFCCGLWALIQLASSINPNTFGSDIAQLPILKERLQKAENRIHQLTSRVKRLEKELELNSTITTTPGKLISAQDDDDDGFRLNGKGINGINGLHPTTQMAQPPPPPPPLPPQNFQFTTSTPTQIHSKSLNHGGNKEVKENGDNNGDDWDCSMKRKKPRINMKPLPEELIQQKKLLRKMPAEDSCSMGRSTSLPTIPENRSPSTIMKDALKIKFANVNDITADSTFSDGNTTIAEFSP